MIPIIKKCKTNDSGTVHHFLLPSALPRDSIRVSSHIISSWCFVTKRDSFHEVRSLSAGAAWLCPATHCTRLLCRAVCYSDPSKSTLPFPDRAGFRIGKHPRNSG